MSELGRCELCFILKQIEKNERDRATRNMLVHEAIFQANKMGYIAGYNYLAIKPNSIIAGLVLPDIGEITWEIPAVHQLGIHSDNIEENQKKCRLYIESSRFYTESDPH